MIIEFIINVFLAVVLLLILVLPDASAMPTAMNDAITNISGYYNQANVLFPMDTLFSLITLMLAIEGGIFLFRLSNFAFHKLTGH